MPLDLNDCLRSLKILIFAPCIYRFLKDKSATPRSWNPHAVSVRLNSSAKPKPARSTILENCFWFERLFCMLISFISLSFISLCHHNVNEFIRHYYDFTNSHVICYEFLYKRLLQRQFFQGFFGLCFFYGNAATQLAIHLNYIVYGILHHGRLISHRPASL